MNFRKSLCRVLGTKVANYIINQNTLNLSCVCGRRHLNTISVREVLNSMHIVSLEPI